MRTAKDAGKCLKFELYKEAMRALERSNHPSAWGGWNVIRCLGKEILNDHRAFDADCAEAVILKYRRKRR